MNIKKITYSFFKYYTIVLSAVFTIILILSLTELPFWMYYYLGVSFDDYKQKPDYVVVMGGGGMPSETGLIRCYYAGLVKKNFPKSKFIIAIPGDSLDTTSALNLMKKEIVNRGVEPENIILLNKGTNTRAQALELRKLLPKSKSLYIISSPEHIYRAVKTFKKAGFEKTVGVPAFEKAIDIDLSFDGKKLGGNELIPDIGENTQLRYQFWNHLKYQVIVYREYFAITYYKLKGWI